MRWLHRFMYFSRPTGCRHVILNANDTPMVHRTTALSIDKTASDSACSTLLVRSVCCGNLDERARGNASERMDRALKHSRHLIWHGRVDEALELVKELARSHRAMQAASLNSVARALAAHNVARALRMVSFMTTLGLPTYHDTTITLIGACARQHRAAEAEELYWCASLPGILLLRAACRSRASCVWHPRSVDIGMLCLICHVHDDVLLEMLYCNLLTVLPNIWDHVNFPQFDK